MSAYHLDEVDRQLLNRLQRNSRRPAIELAEEVGVSDNTVHNRMERLVDAGVIGRYTTSIDYERIGLDLYFQFACTTRISDRADVAEKARQLPEVVEVTELMTGQRNLHVKALGAENDDITRVAEQLDDLALEINDENLIRAERRLPLNLVEAAPLLEGSD